MTLSSPNAHLITTINDIMLTPQETQHTVPPPYLDVCIAGGIGGSMADFIMHSVDTVKTRLQGQPHVTPLKYENMMQTFRTILREEGISRGLYSGITPAISGSIPATTLYFGTYELTKRTLTAKEVGCPDTIAHLAAGSIGDVAASIVYVPSEVIKTRMQLQGRYNNPHFISGYNYRNTWHAAKMIVKYDGFGSLYHGYKATLLRDVPFSALQFAFYEKFKQLALVHWVTPGDPLTLGAELACGSFAGGIAGAMTTPLDVVKTLLQTQQKRKKSSSSKHSSIPSSAASSKPIMTSPSPTQPPTQTKYYTGILDGLLWNYRHQGLGGLFRGIGPRVFWTSLQSAAMFVIYEQVLRVQDEARTSGTWPYGGERGRPWWSARDVAEAIEGRERKGDGRGWRGGVL